MSICKWFVYKAVGRLGFDKVEMLNKVFLLPISFSMILRSHITRKLALSLAKNNRTVFSFPTDSMVQNIR